MTAFRLPHSYGTTAEIARLRRNKSKERQPRLLALQPDPTAAAGHRIRRWDQVIHIRRKKSKIVQTLVF